MTENELRAIANTPGDANVAWRTEPPTIDERRTCQVWWLRSSKSQNIHIVVFDKHPNCNTALIDYSDSTYVDILEWHFAETGESFNPDEWPGEWAPCLPPNAVCNHSRTIRGADAPLRHGSHQTQVCLACGAFRRRGHDPNRTVKSDWIPASEYEVETSDLDDAEA